MVEAGDIFYLGYTEQHVLAILLWFKMSGVGWGKLASVPGRAFVGDTANTYPRHCNGSPALAALSGTVLSFTTFQSEEHIFGAVIWPFAYSNVLRHNL